MLRALVVDDEKPARDDLAWMLDRQDEIASVDQASSGSEAIKLLSGGGSAAFDVLFLDILMPELDGMDIARMVGRFESPPAIVFVTAFDAPAAEAFELGVVDYLRKPVAADRLSRSIERVKASRRIETEERDLQPECLFVSTSAGRQLLLRPDDVLFFEASGDYVRVHAEGESFLVRDTLSRLTDAWIRHGFVRVHRGYSVRMAAVDEVRSGANGRHVLVGGQEIPVSRRYTRDLTARLTGEAGPTA